MEDAIRAVIGREAPAGRVDAVARVLVERGEREPGVAAIVDAVASIDETPTECGSCGGTEWVIVQGGDVVCGNCGAPSGGRCRYKPNCPNSATGTVDAPALRDLYPDGVPACDPCQEYVSGVTDTLAEMREGAAE